MQHNLAIPFYNRATDRPDSNALFIDDSHITYGELARQAGLLAGWLHKNLSAPNTQIGILAARSTEAYVGLLGALWAGCAYVPLNPKFPADYLRKLIETCDLGAIIIDQNSAKHLAPELLNELSIPVISPCSPVTSEHYRTLNPEQLATASSLKEPLPVSSQTHAYLMFTSGSTGEPKGIAATIDNVAHFISATQDRYQLKAADRFSQFNDLNWDPSVFDLLCAWNVGASVYVVPDNDLMAPAHFIKRHQLTVWYSIPFQISMMAQMRQLKPGSFPSLRLSLFVGEPLTRTAAKAWQNAACNSLIENVYGPTETTVVCLGQPFSDSPGCITPERDYVAIGTPYDSARVAIIDESRRFLGAAQHGELAIAGPQVTPGYWRDQKMTDIKFLRLRHPVFGESRWYLTGDQGYQDDMGCFHFLGRNDNQVQVLGKRIELEEVETELRKLSGCGEVSVLAWPIKDGLAQGLLGFLNDPGADSTSLKEALRSKLPSYMIPKRIIGLKGLPRNNNGKIDRKQLLSDYLDR